MNGRCSRRRFLATVGVGATATAGCLGLGESSDGTPTAASDPLAPPRRGAPDAPVTVSVFVDFACPHCRSFHRNTVPLIDREYVETGVVTYEHRDFPLPVDDPGSYRAANAARAVQHTQGADVFFEFASGLFENQSDLGLSLYESLADAVGADPGAVRSAAKRRVYATTLDRDVALGRGARIESTPSILVDGDLFRGETWDDLARWIESARSE